MLTDARYMSHLLDCLHENSLPAGGMAFAGWRDKILPDYSPESLHRVAMLLKIIGSKYGARAFNRLSAERAGQNFLLTLAAYLAEYVARQSNNEYVWRPDDHVSFFGGWQFRPVMTVRLLLEGQQDGLNLDDGIWQSFRMNPDADRAKMSEFLLGHYAKYGTAPQGLAFAEEAAALPPHNNRDTVQAIDALLLRLHREHNITPDTFHSRFDHYAGKNFLLLLAFRIGKSLAADAGHTESWLNTPDGEDHFYDGFVLEWENGGLPVLRLLKRALCSGSHLFAAPPAVVPPPDPNAAARRAIDGLLNPHYQGEPPPPLAHLDELQAAGLDYSLHSLAKIDKLLAQLRMQRHDFDRFVRDAGCLNLLHFCAFYLARTAAELSHNTLKFIGYQEAKQQLPELPKDWFSQYAAVIGNQIYFPFGRVISLIWDMQPETACATFAQQLCQSQSGHLHVCPVPPPAQSHAPLPELSHKILQQAGFAAACALYLRQQHHDFKPMLVEPHPQRHWNMAQLMIDDPAEAVAYGLNRLDENPDRLPCGLLCYEGAADLPRGRFPALRLDIRTYRGDMPLHIQAALPLLRGDDGGIAIGALAIDSPHPQNDKEAAAAAARIYQGMDEFHAPDRPKGHWRKSYRDYL